MTEITSSYRRGRSEKRIHNFGYSMAIHGRHFSPWGTARTGAIPSISLLTTATRERGRKILPSIFYPMVSSYKPTILILPPCPYLVGSCRFINGLSLRLVIFRHRTATITSEPLSADQSSQGYPISQLQTHWMRGISVSSDLW
jgi:hypothetical protein